MTRQRAINNQRRRLLQGIEQAQASRRSVLAGAAGLALAGLLSACGTKGTSSGNAAALAPATDLSDSEAVVNWANWTLYLDYDEKAKNYPTLQRFMKESGLKAKYAEDIDSNDSYYGKVQAQLAAGQDIGQDLMVFSDWMTERIIRQGYAQELDHNNIPNIKNLLPALQEVRSIRGAEVPDLAVRLHRPGLEQGGVPQGAAQRRGPVGSGAQGTHLHARRDARHDADADARRRRGHRRVLGTGRVRPQPGSA